MPNFYGTSGPICAAVISKYIFRSPDVIVRESPSLVNGVRFRSLSLRSSWVQIPSPAHFSCIEDPHASKTSEAVRGASARISELYRGTVLQHDKNRRQIKT